MAEPPEGPADDPPEPPDLPEEPLGYDSDEDVDGLLDEPPGDDEASEGDRERHLFEEPQIADASGEPHTEETAVVRGDPEQHHTDETESASGDDEGEEDEAGEGDDGGPATELHLIGEDDEEEPEDLRYHDIEETDYHSLEEAVHTPEEIRQRRLADKAARRRAGRQRLGVLVAAVAVIVVIVLLTTGSGGKSPPSKAPSTSPIARAGQGPSNLFLGSSSALPSNILIADRGNGRLVAISSSGQQVWSSNLSGPSDAYITNTGRSITVTEHTNMQVYVLGVASGKVDYHYGHAHIPGSGLNRLHDPATAQFLPDGRLVIADKANCRILLVTRPSHHRVTQLGKVGTCVHNPPHDFANPAAAFPTADGGLVVTEHTPPWVDILGKNLTLVADMQPTGLTEPDDANEYAPTPGRSSSSTAPARSPGPTTRRRDRACSTTRLLRRCFRTATSSSATPATTASS